MVGVTEDDEMKALSETRRKVHKRLYRMHRKAKQVHVIIRKRTPR